MTAPYNYETFPLDLDEALFNGFREAIHLGDKAPDGVLVDANTGAETSLKKIRAKRPVVIEFGSYS
ncbi:MAG: hypothetical protein KC912_21375 [Proteobacteria bacterium]|nr:hypothetical protein [Pseudomonadota bacterium]